MSHSMILDNNKNNKNNDTFISVKLKENSSDIIKGEKDYINIIKDLKKQLKEERENNEQ